MDFRIVHAVSDMVSRNVRRSRLRTPKVLDRLTFCPAKHKRKEARKRIKALQVACREYVKTFSRRCTKKIEIFG